MTATRVVIPLGAHEVQYCALIAERRNVVKDPHGVRNRRVQSGKSDFETHLIGVMGEYATAKHFGIKIDTTVSLSGDDKVSDMQIGAQTVQIKTRLPQRPPLYLYFLTQAGFRADVAICAFVPSPATVELVGWIGRQEFSDLAQPVDLRYGIRYAVTEDQLHPMGDW